MGEVYRVLDVYPLEESCPNCGQRDWIVDSDGEAKFWLLCTDPEGRGCLQIVDLPAKVKVAF